MNTPPPLPPQAPPPGIPSLRPTNSFPKQAALFSLVAPFVGFGIGIFGQQAVQGNRAAAIILGCISTLLILTGFVLGIIALFGIKKYGKKGILGRAIAGVCINGVIILLALIAIPSYARAADIQRTFHALQGLPRDKVEAAVQSFARYRQANGAVLPATVTFRELVSTGYLQTNEVAAFGGKDVSISLGVDNAHPQVVWIRVNVTKNRDIVELTDGSIMLVPK